MSEKLLWKNRLCYNFPVPLHCNFIASCPWVTIKVSLKSFPEPRTKNWFLIQASLARVEEGHAPWQPPGHGVIVRLTSRSRHVLTYSWKNQAPEPVQRAMLPTRLFYQTNSCTITFTSRLERGSNLDRRYRISPLHHWHTGVQELCWAWNTIHIYKLNTHSSADQIGPM